MCALALESCVLIVRGCSSAQVSRFHWQFALTPRVAPTRTGAPPFGVSGNAVLVQPNLPKLVPSFAVQKVQTAKREATNMRSWEMTVVLDPAGELPLFLQLAEAVVADIRRGRLPPGARLPGSRTLASTLHIHRNTVLAGYDELAAQGWTYAKPAGGTFIAHHLPVSLKSLRPALGLARCHRPPGYDIAPPLDLPTPAVWPPTTLVLTKGAPDPRLVPVAELSRAYRRALGRHGAELLGYGDPRGHVRLRTALAEMLSTARGILTTADDLLVTRGSQMAVDLAARALLKPGDAVAVEAIGNRATWTALRLTGAEVFPVPVDTAGLDVTALAQLSERKRIRAVYVTPHHQFPTTAVMPAARRMQLLELARSRRMAVIEDDYDHDFHYEGRPVLPLAARDQAGVVVYIGTLSKVLAPGLRIGYVVAPKAVLDRVRSLRQVADLQGDLAHECAVAELFEDGELMRHIRRVRRIYRTRRDALVEALRNRLGQAVDFHIPEGGMALWARIAPDIDIAEWSKRGLHHGVAFVSGSIYATDESPMHCMRLGFSLLDVHELDEAVSRMASALKECKPSSSIRHMREESSYSARP
jgi:GntR family transcriptional regulator/MocR family aminotransferase